MPPKRTRRGDVIVLTTVSAEGFPHHTFLSDDEVAFRSGTVALSILAASRSRENLEARRRATLLRTDGGVLRATLALRRARSKPLAADPERRLVVLAVVRDVEAKPLPGEAGRLAGGLTYTRREAPEERARRTRAARELSG